MKEEHKKIINPYPSDEYFTWKGKFKHAIGNGITDYVHGKIRIHLKQPVIDNNNILIYEIPVVYKELCNDMYENAENIENMEKYNTTGVIEYFNKDRIGEIHKYKFTIITFNNVIKILGSSDTNITKFKFLTNIIKDTNTNIIKGKILNNYDIKIGHFELYNNKRYDEIKKYRSCGCIIV